MIHEQIDRTIEALYNASAVLFGAGLTVGSLEEEGDWLSRNDLVSMMGGELTARSYLSASLASRQWDIQRVVRDQNLTSRQRLAVDCALDLCTLNFETQEELAR